MDICVNGTVISEREIARETQYHPGKSLEEARRMAAEALVVRELLLQQLKRLNLDASDEPEEAKIDALIASEVKTPSADIETCRRYYDTHQNRFRSPDLIEARHILIAAKGDGEQAFATARLNAQNAIDVLKERPDQFPELARELSACPSAKQGGSLGQLTRGSTVPELDTFLFELEPGQLCPVPIRSRYGFHVLEVRQRIDGKTLPFESVQEKIATYLEERVWRQAVRQYNQLHIGSSNITGIELSGSASPLVQ
jgi:peptidyl-prolyl cis-trans isomerase C